MDLRWMGPEDRDVVLAAGHLFDAPAEPGPTDDFLADPRHHLCIAFVDDEPAGFVSGVATTHPDKGTEMFLYELGVEEPFQGRGLATALIEALAARARSIGCYGMWVLTERENEAAMRTYARAGGAEPTDEVMFSWTF